jgi:hypothetical protein
MVPEEQKDRQIDVAGIEVESLVMAIVLMRPAQPAGAHFARIIQSGKVFDAEKKESLVFIEAVEPPYAVITKKKYIEPVRAFFD